MRSCSGGAIEECALQVTETQVRKRSETSWNRVFLVRLVQSLFADVASSRFTCKCNKWNHERLSKKAKNRKPFIRYRLLCTVKQRKQEQDINILGLSAVRSLLMLLMISQIYTSIYLSMLLNLDSEIALRFGRSLKLKLICVLLVDKPKQIASDILRVGVALSIGRV
ncbi:hypothetical protein K1719_042946 [Acacia pycnantha]|nr:hypothetical protein K1719_042946 [Acacia pycnantha]